MAIHITSRTKSLRIQPTTKYELRDIIAEEIKRQGPDADLNHIDTSLITDMSMLFGMINIGNIKVDQWNVSNVTNMDKLFCGCIKFNCDLSRLDVSNVTDMDSMFDCCIKFNRDLSGWDVSNVEYHRSMFYNCPIRESYKPKFNNSEMLSDGVNELNRIMRELFGNRLY